MQQMSAQDVGGVVNTMVDMGASAELAIQQTNNGLAECFMVFGPCTTAERLLA